jgi:hypothetical protein
MFYSCNYDVKGWLDAVEGCRSVGFSTDFDNFACAICEDASQLRISGYLSAEAVQLKKLELRLLQGSKAVVASAIVLTSFCAIAVLDWQLENFLSGQGWFPITVSDVLQPTHQYSTASFNGEPSRLSAADTIYSWFLALPALFPLMLVLGLLAMYYQYLKSAEQEIAGR